MDKTVGKIVAQIEIRIIVPLSVKLAALNWTAEVRVIVSNYAVKCSPIANPEFTITQHNPDLIWDHAEIGQPAVLITKSLEHPSKSD